MWSKGLLLPHMKRTLPPLQLGVYCNGDLLISIRTDACGLVVFRAVHVGAVVKSPVSSPDGSPSSLV